MAKKEKVIDSPEVPEAVESKKKSIAVVYSVESKEVLRTFSLETHGEGFEDMALNFVKKPSQFFISGPLKGQPKYAVRFK